MVHCDKSDGSKCLILAAGSIINPCCRFKVFKYQEKHTQEAWGGVQESEMEREKTSPREDVKGRVHVRERK